MQFVTSKLDQSRPGELKFDNLRQLALSYPKFVKIDGAINQIRKKRREEKFLANVHLLHEIYRIIQFFQVCSTLKYTHAQFYSHPSNIHTQCSHHVHVHVK
ncbi:unnamed protein product [Rhizophagus irregularis]|nr:unnamed protein product [Rhizophagus irregularis]